MITIVSGFFILLTLMVRWADSQPHSNSKPKTVFKTNSLPIYVHYMPWYENPSSLGNGKWGLHWTMANQNPEIVDNNDRRQIASHFYPLIGPYASGDPALIEYHLLLMKYSGVDGILIDWSSSHDVLDYHLNRRNAEALIDQLDSIGLYFAIVYEDYTTSEVAIRSDSMSVKKAAHIDLNYISNNYFGLESYISINRSPLFLVFGPRQFLSNKEWMSLLDTCNPTPHFVPLWNRSKDLQSVASGEFAWVDSSKLRGLSNYYKKQAYKLPWVLGAAYPGFNDFYIEGGWDNSALGWKVPYGGVKTFSQTLGVALSSDLDALQLVTWNDFGEGTMIEPTEEFGYSFLEQLQIFSGVKYNRDDLQLIFQLYKLRKKHEKSPEIQAQLDSAFFYFSRLDPTSGQSFMQH